MGSKTTKLVSALLVAAAGTWFYFTPHLAAREMWSAAQAKDSVRLASHIDLPAVRESVKAGLQARISTPAPDEDAQTGVLRSFGASVAGALMTPMIDALVTPEGIARVMKGDRPRLLKTAPSTPSTSPSGASGPDTETTMAYEDFDHFLIEVRRQGSETEPVGLVLQRQGLFRWKLSALRLPL